MYFIEGRILIESYGEFCLYVFLAAYNVPSICPRQNASPRAYSAPNSTSTTVCTAAAQATNARKIKRVP